MDVLAGAQPEFQPAARAFLARFPGAAMTLALPDFTLYRLNVEGGRLVLGFGHALNLSASLLHDLAKRLTATPIIRARSWGHGRAAGRTGAGDGKAVEGGGRRRRVRPSP